MLLWSTSVGRLPNAPVPHAVSVSVSVTRPIPKIRPGEINTRDCDWSPRDFSLSLQPQTQVHELGEKSVEQTVPSHEFEPTAESGRFVWPLSWRLGFRMRFQCGHRTSRSPVPKARAYFLLSTPTPDNAYMFRHGYTWSTMACPAA